jgi:hypothetical protein
MPGSHFHKSMRLWRDWRVKYPFHATTSTAIRPTDVPGRHVSVVLDYGVRTWGFESETDRDEFVRTHAEARIVRA